MIPFVAIDESKIAPLHPYGICCALAFFAWDFALLRMAVRRGFDRADVRMLTIWLGVLGWSFAWAVDALFCRPGQLDLRLLAVQGLSSTGAIVGAAIGTALWCHVSIRKDGTRWRISRREEPYAILPISEVIVSTWPIAFAFGRLGCALIHDHVGKTVAAGSLGSLLAVGFPRSMEDGLHHVIGPLVVITGASDVRYDLGLLELFVLTPLAIGFALSLGRNVAMGSFTMIAALVYGPFRFFLDFLRAEGPAGEPRLGGLTFAQYWSLAVIALGIVLFLRRRRERRAEATFRTADP